MNIKCSISLEITFEFMLVNTHTHIESFNFNEMKFYFTGNDGYWVFVISRGFISIKTNDFNKINSTVGEKANSIDVF
jgi:hypothetical protein